MGKLIKIMRGSFSIMFLSSFLKGAAAIVELIIPYLMGVLVNQAIQNQQKELIIKLLWMMVGLTVIAVVLNLSAHYFAGLFSQNVGFRVRKKLFARIEHLSVEQMNKFEDTTMITRVTNDIENVQNALNMMVRPLTRGTVMVVGGLLFSFRTNVAITLPILFGMLVVAGLSAALLLITTRDFEKIQKTIDRMTQILRENVSGIRFIKSMNKGDYELNRFRTQVEQAKKMESRVGIFQGMIQPAIRFISDATLVAVVILGQVLYAKGKITIGDIFTVTNYVSMIIMASNMIPRILIMISRASTSAERILEILDTLEPMEYGVCKVSDNNEENELEFSHVTFTYPGATAPALTDISFSIKKGQTVGIIGDTGSGKTTLLYLILRFYEPQQGEIRFRGKNIKEYDKESYRQAVTGALQQIDIFQSSFKHNICFSEKPDSQQLEKALVTAQLYTLYQKRQQDAQITQRGTNLSGGQRQRVNIARALYRNAAITIFDDVSSGLDYKTDMELRRALKKNYANHTCIISSQRVASIRNADIILVLEQGALVAVGAHKSLTEHCNAYNYMCLIQKNGDGEVAG